MATRKKAAEEDKQIVINIKQADRVVVDLTLVGDTSLICHNWSEKAKIIMRQNQQAKEPNKSKNKPKEPRRPILEFAESLNWIPEKPALNTMTDDEILDAVANGKFGFPVCGIKKAAIEGAYQMGFIKKQTTARGCIYMTGIDHDEYATIEGVCVSREDLVRVANGSADLRYRAEFKAAPKTPQWKMVVRCEILFGIIQPEELANMIYVGGVTNGIGDWRQAKDGIHGRFHVETRTPVQIG